MTMEELSETRTLSLVQGKKQGRRKFGLVRELAASTWVARTPAVHDKRARVVRSANVYPGAGKNAGKK
jgi:hypothetical protein